MIPVTSVERLLSLAGELGHLVVIGTHRPASTGPDAIRRILALRPGEPMATRNLKSLDEKP